MKAIGIMTLALLLTGCGSRQALQPAPGQSLPLAPAMTARAPTVPELLEAPPIARPERVDELLRRSERRPDDRFDLPPAGVPAGVVPIPVDGPDRR